MSFTSTQKQTIRKEFIHYVSLNVMSMVGLSAYVLADTFFVANGVGHLGLTSLNLVLPAYSLVNGLGLMFGMGAATRYSVLKGEGQDQKANRVFTDIVLLAAFLGVILTAVGTIFAGNIATFLGADAQTLPFAKEYLGTLLAFTCPFFLNNVIICFVRNDNSPKLSMFAMLAGSLSNIVLDYIFIFPLKMGMFGAAFATGLAPIISLLVLSRHFVTKKNNFRLIKGIPNIISLGGSIILGFPSFITEFSSGIVMFAFNTAILSISGNIGVAAYGIIANLALIVVAVYTGIAQGIQPLISRNFGSRNTAVIDKLLKYACLTAIAGGLVFTTLGILFRMNLIWIFNSENNAELALIAAQGIQIYFPAFILMGINIVMTTFFSSVMQAAPSFLISLTRGCAAVLLFVVVLPIFFGINGVWAAVPMAELTALIISLAALMRYQKTNAAMTTRQTFSASQETS